MNVRRDADLDGKMQKARKSVSETQKTCLLGGQGGWCGWGGMSLSCLGCWQIPLS